MARPQAQSKPWDHCWSWGLFYDHTLPLKAMSYMAKSQRPLFLGKLLINLSLMNMACMTGLCGMILMLHIPSQRGNLGDDLDQLWILVLP